MDDHALQLVAHIGRQGLGQLYDDWLKLIPRIEDCCFSHYPQWYDAYLNRRAEGNDSVIFCALYRGQHLIAVFPVIIRKIKPLSMIAIMIPNHGPLSMPDFIIPCDENHDELFEFFIKNLGSALGTRWNVLRVFSTLETSHASRCLGTRTLRGVRVRTASRCNILKLEPYDEMIRGYSRKFRSSLRNARNRLAKLECVTVLRVRERENIGWAFNEFVKLESSGWKGKDQHGKANYEAGSAIASFDAKYAFYKGVVDNFSASGLLEINLLRASGKTIAAYLALSIGDTCFMLKTTYDENFARLSPGNMLLERLLQDYAGHPTIKYVNMVSDYRWLGNWNPHQLQYMNYEYFNRKTPKGLLVYLLLRIKRTLKHRLAMDQPRRSQPGAGSAKRGQRQTQLYYAGTSDTHSGPVKPAGTGKA